MHESAAIEPAACRRCGTSHDIIIQCIPTQDRHRIAVVSCSLCRDEFACAPWEYYGDGLQNAAVKAWNQLNATNPNPSED